MSDLKAIGKFFAELKLTWCCLQPYHHHLLEKIQLSAEILSRIQKDTIWPLSTDPSWRNKIDQTNLVLKKIIFLAYEKKKKKKKKKLPQTLNITILNCKHATLLFEPSSLPAYIWLNWGVVMMQVWWGFRLIDAVKANPVECRVIPINMIFHLKHHNNTKDIRKRKE